VAARIIPFLRPVPKEAPVGIRPPIATRFREDYVVAGFLGTKEQLIAWDVAEELRRCRTLEKRFGNDAGRASLRE
jgi:hypothetical protein